MKTADQREEVLFAEVLKRPCGSAREAFLDVVCLGDLSLRARLEALIQAHERSDSSCNPELKSTDVQTLVLPPEECPETQIGHYKLLEKIGEGGFGVVYVAEQREPVKRRVALKIIKLGMDTRQVVARFEAERQALAMMDHPNIAKVLDAGATETGRPFFVMELVKGIPITHYCEQEKTDTTERLNLFIQICHAIQHAHQKGIIHRDIKPSNILVTLHDGVPVPKVIDFGIAKATQAELTEKTVYTQFQQFIGTPAYMSPEQAEMSGLDIDTRADIYSLGVLLYELLTGCTPFDAKELMQSGLDEMRKIIRQREPVRPSTRLRQTASLQASSAPLSNSTSTLSTDLDWIVMKCLEKDRTRRYETANGLAMDLDRHLHHEPVAARPPSATYRIQKFVQRNKVVVVAAGAVALVLVLGVLASAWQAVRATTEAARADQNAQQAALSAYQAEQARQKEAQLRQAAQAQAYAADMNLIQEALGLNNRGKAVELLDRHRPKPGEPDLRGWEWRYLWRQCQSERHTSLPQRPGGIWSLAASADGQWLAVGEHLEGRLSLWDLQASTQIPAPPAGLGSVRVAFSPAAALLAFSLQATNGEHHVRFWDTTTRREVGKDLPLGGDCVGLAFSQDGQRLATYAAVRTNEVALWRVPDGVKLAGYPVPPFDILGGTYGTPFATATDLSVAAVAPGNTIHLLDLSTGRVRWSARAALETVKALSLSPDGKTLASASGFVESDVRLWDVPSGGELPRLQGHRAWVGGLVFWPDSKQLASASADQTIRLWNLTDRSNVPPARVLHGHNLEVWRLALLPDARTLVSGSKDGSVYRWDTRAIERERTVATLPAKVTTWRFASDSQSVFTLDIEGSVAQWKGAQFQDCQTLMNIGGGRPYQPRPLGYAACFSGDGSLLAVGSTNGNVQVWDVGARTLLHEQRVSTGALEPVQFLAERKSLVIVCRDEGSESEASFQEWSLAPWRKTTSWQGGEKMRYFALSPDGRWCLTFAQAVGVLRDLQTGNERPLRVDMKLADNAAFAPNARLFGVGSSFGHGKLWQTADRVEVMAVHGLLMGLHSVAFSPDVKRLVTGSTGAEAIKFWDLDSHLDLLTLAGQGSLFQRTAFSPDGNVLGSVNNQRILHLWRAPSWAEIEGPEKATEGQAQ
jgi:serine/threonine protein kinase/WD40 repeat protein